MTFKLIRIYLVLCQIARARQLIHLHNIHCTISISVFIAVTHLIELPIDFAHSFVHQSTLMDMASQSLAGLYIELSATRDSYLNFIYVYIYLIFNLYVHDIYPSRLN